MTIRKTQPYFTSGSAVSEVISIILMVSIVVTSISIISLSLLSQPSPRNLNSLEFSVERIGNYLLIHHSGGDEVKPGDIIIVIDGGNIPYEQISLVNFTSKTDTWSTPWSLGYSLFIDLSTVFSDPESVRTLSIIEKAGPSERTLLIANISIPAQSESSVSSPSFSFTPEPTPIPCPAVKANFSTSFSETDIYGLQCIDYSYGGTITSWSWSFDHGSKSITRSEQNPYVVLDKKGNWWITLWVRNSCGNTAYLKEQVHVVE